MCVRKQRFEVSEKESEAKSATGREQQGEIERDGERLKKIEKD